MEGTTTKQVRRGNVEWCRAHSLRFQPPVRVKNMGDLVRDSPLALVAVQGAPPFYKVNSLFKPAELLKTSFFACVKLCYHALITCSVCLLFPVCLSIVYLLNVFN